MLLNPRVFMSRAYLSFQIISLSSFCIHQSPSRFHLSEMDPSSCLQTPSNFSLPENWFPTKDLIYSTAVSKMSRKALETQNNGHLGRKA